LHLEEGRRRWGSKKLESGSENIKKKLPESGDPGDQRGMTGMKRREKKTGEHSKEDESQRN